MSPALEPEPRRPREIALSPAAASSRRPGAGPASRGDLPRGAGVVSSLGTDLPCAEPAFPVCPGEGLPHLSPSPLLPPTAAAENSCLRGTAPSGRPRFPPRFRGPGGDGEEGGARRGPCGRRPRAARLPGPPHRHARRRCGGPRVAGSRTGPAGAPWCQPVAIHIS